jgi:hypothetical protein
MKWLRRISWQTIGLMLLMCGASWASTTGFAGWDTPVNWLINGGCIVTGTAIGAHGAIHTAEHAVHPNSTWGQVIGRSLQTCGGAGVALKGQSLLPLVGLSASALIHLLH